MQAPEKISIRDLSLEQLTEQIVALGEPSFRAKQIYEWLWKKSAVQFSEMLNLSKSLREQLESHYTINAIVIDVQQKSMDGTIKCRFKLVDGHMIEGVLIP